MRATQVDRSCGSALPLAEMLKAVPQLAALGPVFKTCAPVQVRAGSGARVHSPFQGCIHNAVLAG